MAPKIKKEKPEKISLDYYINALTINKIPVDEIDFKDYSSFIINKLISTTNNYLPLISLINTKELSDRDHYIFLKSVLPQAKIYKKFYNANARYVKASFAISKFYECGTRDADIYINKLPKKEIDRIIEIVGDHQ